MAISTQELTEEEPPRWKLAASATMSVGTVMFSLTLIMFIFLIPTDTTNLPNQNVKVYHERITEATSTFKVDEGWITTYTQLNDCLTVRCRLYESEYDTQAPYAEADLNSIVERFGQVNEAVSFKCERSSPDEVLDCKRITMANGVEFVVRLQDNGPGTNLKVLVESYKA